MNPLLSTLIAGVIASNPSTLDIADKPAKHAKTRNPPSINLAALDTNMVDRDTINFYLEWFNEWLGAPKGTLFAIANNESAYNPNTGQFLNVRNAVGAIGLMQLMPIALTDLRQHYGVNIDPYNPVQSIIGAALMFVINYRYLTARNTPNISWAALVVAYNGGWSAGRSYALTGVAPSAEGRNYVAKWQDQVGIA